MWNTFTITYLMRVFNWKYTRNIVVDKHFIVIKKMIRDLLGLLLQKNCLTVCQISTQFMKAFTILYNCYSPYKKVQSMTDNWWIKVCIFRQILLMHLYNNLIWSLIFPSKMLRRFIKLQNLISFIHSKKV